MSQTMVSIRMDTELKTSMEAVCHELGMNMTTAFTIFARKVCREHRIPFDVSVEPNADTLAAMDEYRAIKADPESYKHYASFREAMNEVLNDA